MSLPGNSHPAPEPSEHLYRLLVEGVKDHALFMIDRAGQVMTWNAGGERLTGYRAEEIVGRHISCLYDHVDVADDKPSRDLETAVARGQFEDEDWRLRKDGSRFWACSVITPLGDQSDRQGFVISMWDIADHRRQDEALRSVLDHVLDGIVTIDGRGCIQSFNPAAENIFDYQADEVLGQNVKMLMPEPYHGEHDGYLANYLDTGRAKIIGIGREVVGRRRDGSTFPMDLAVSEFQLHGRRYFTGIVRDITERKRLEQELKRRITELAETDRKKDEFLAMLAHELRNPLAAISNAVQLSGQFADPQQSEWSEKVINRQIKHLSRMIEDLLDVSRITRGKIQLRKEVIDIAPVLDSAVQNVRPMINERKQVLAVTAATGTLWVDADATRLEQILTNLLNNATKYTDSGGRIWLTALREGDDVVIRVRDTGIGIRAEKLSQVFELFAQGDRSLARQEGGLGIGLTLARSLAELHGGSLSAASDGPGKGSEFTFRLPAAARPGVGSAAEKSAAATYGSGSRVLVVDDNVELALGLARLLKLLGHDVRMAHDGPTA
ncbi:MAG: PAS domain-containing sensor histidine kinase, partial [Isosphaeraceae bacterium]